MTPPHDRTHDVEREAKSWRERPAANDQGARPTADELVDEVPAADGGNGSSPPTSPENSDSADGLGGDTEVVTDHAAEPVDMRQAALDFVEATGLKIFPLWWVRRDGSCACPAGAKCGRRSGKHPWLEWKEAASSDAEQVDRWWRERPLAGIGLRTGAVNGLRAIDVDGAIGEQELQQLERELGALPETVEQTTGNGRHLFFEWDDAELGNVDLGKKLNTRCNGGYVVLAPTLHYSGKRYQEHPTRALGRFPLARMPEAWCCPPRPRSSTSTSTPVNGKDYAPASATPSARLRAWLRAAVDDECAELARMPPDSGRNNLLIKAAYSLAGYFWAGLDRHETKLALELAATRCGLERGETQRAIANGFKKGVLKRRPVPNFDDDGSNDYRAADGGDRSRGDSESTDPLAGFELPPPHTDEDRHGGTGEPPPPDGAPDGSARRIELVGPSVISQPLTPMRWACPALQLGGGRPNMFAGYAWSLKTLAAMSMNVSLAAGVAIFGRFAVPSPMRVVHLDFEMGRRAVFQRYQRLVLGMGLTWDMLGDRLQVACMPAVYLTSRDAYAALLRIAEGADSVLVDSLCAASPGMDENASAAREQLDLLTRLSEEAGEPMFTVLHHMGKAAMNDRHPGDARTKPRGSSAIFDACGAVYELTRKSPKKPVHVSMTKSPGSAKGESVAGFDLIVEDVRVGDDPTGGMRVVSRATSSSAVLVEEANQQFEERASKILAIVKAKPGCSGRHIRLHAKMGRAPVADLLDELVDQGRLCALPSAYGKATSYRVGDGT